MKKIFLLLTLLFILFSCGDTSVEEDKNLVITKEENIKIKLDNLNTDFNADKLALLLKIDKDLNESMDLLLIDLDTIKTETDYDLIRSGEISILENKFNIIKEKELSLLEMKYKKLEWGISK